MLSFRHKKQTSKNAADTTFKRKDSHSKELVSQIKIHPMKLTQKDSVPMGQTENVSYKKPS